MPLAEYKYDPATYKVTDEMISRFNDEGGILVRDLFSKEEVDKIVHQLTSADEFTNRAYELADGKGLASRLVVWSHPGDDVTGMVARCDRVVGTCAKLLGGEVYHYHSKIMMKQPRTGGSFLWHQDYGYWYQNGCLRPDMMTAYIALDKCTKENGCLQAVLGTHKCGRIDHTLEHGQTVAEQKRVDELVKNFEHMYLELNPGDCFFFHSNVLHTSDKNDSDTRRWAFLIAYNRADNDPVYKHHHPNYTPITTVADGAVIECNQTGLQGKEFIDLNSYNTTFKATLIQSNFH